MAKRLPPIKDNPIFRGMVNDLKKQTPDQIQALREASENGTLSAATDSEEDQAGPEKQADNND